MQSSQRRDSRCGTLRERIASQVHRKRAGLREQARRKKNQNEPHSQTSNAINAITILTPIRPSDVHFESPRSYDSFLAIKKRGPTTALSGVNGHKPRGGENVT
jgi:hypothetical protein